MSVVSGSFQPRKGAGFPARPPCRFPPSPRIRVDVHFQHVGEIPGGAAGPPDVFREDSAGVIQVVRGHLVARGVDRPAHVDTARVERVGHGPRTGVPPAYDVTKGICVTRGERRLLSEQALRVPSGKRWFPSDPDLRQGDMHAEALVDIGAGFPVPFVIDPGMQVTVFRSA